VGVAFGIMAMLTALPPALAAPGFDARLSGRVFAAALNFATPRLLDANSARQLAEWGLHGITVLDPSLTVTGHGDMLTLSDHDHQIATATAPPEGDAEAWGHTAAGLSEAAFAASPTLRHAGGQALVQSFFDEMFTHLDPYSRYVPPAPAEAARDRLAVDASAGLGLVRQHGGTVIADIVPGGPGFAAGARIGDRILAIDGQRVSNASLARVQALLTGPEGTLLDVQVRGLDGQTRELDLGLAYVPPETVFTERQDGLLILRISSYTSNTAERLSQAVEAGMAASPPPRALVLDLRGNRGGLLRQAVNAVALFAEQGTIASTAGRDPQATHAWRIDGGGDLTHGLHLIILVDGRTASAAEIMAAALADLGRGVVVGSATLGKGLVQTITRLPDGGELFVTWSRVLAPRGWPIQSLGVMPQLCTSQGPDATRAALAALADGRQPAADAIARARAARPPLAAAAALILRQSCPAASGTDLDLSAARFLADNPGAYEAALLK